MFENIHELTLFRHSAINAHDENDGAICQSLNCFRFVNWNTGVNRDV